MEGWFAGVQLNHAPVLSELQPELFKELCTHIAVNSTAFLLDTPGTVGCIGSRTECALLLLMRAWGADYKAAREDTQEAVAYVYSFSSERKSSSVVVKRGADKEASHLEPPPDICMAA